VKVGGWLRRSEGCGVGWRRPWRSGWIEPEPLEDLLLSIERKPVDVPGGRYLGEQRWRGQALRDRGPRRRPDRDPFLAAPVRVLGSHVVNDRDLGRGINSSWSEVSRPISTRGWLGSCRQTFSASERSCRISFTGRSSGGDLLPRLFRACAGTAMVSSSRSSSAAAASTSASLKSGNWSREAFSLFELKRGESISRFQSCRYATSSAWVAIV